MRSQIKHYMLVSVMVIVIIILIAIGLAFLLKHAKTSVNVGSQQKLETKNGKIVLPPDRVPHNFSELQSAPAISLLPEHLPVVLSDASVPAPARKQISSSVDAFLQTWETFNSSIGAGAKNLRKHGVGSPDQYQVKLSRLVVPSSLDDIIARVDSSDPAGVCLNCGTGSSWVPTSLGPSLEIHDYNGYQAYVTVDGIVQYTGDPQSNSLAGTDYYRSYGLLLQKSGQKWLVERAGAETLGEAQL